MTPTLIGAFVVLAGFVLLFTGTRLAMLQFVLFCGLMNGSATVILTSLGNVSIQPALTAALFLALRCILPTPGGSGALARSLTINGWLVLFVSYSFIGAFTLPILFGQSVMVVPLRPTSGALTTVPLQFTPQHLTTSMYMLMTLVGAVCASVAAARQGAGLKIARTASLIGLMHAGIGWFAMLVAGTPLNVIVTFFRNGNYAQLEQTFDGFSRMTGISPEPSLFASFGFAWFVFITELWLRNVDRRWSGPAAIVLFLTLLVSTSSTAYVGLIGYGTIVLLRVIYFSGTIPARKGLVMAACLFALLACGLALIVGSETVASSVGRILQMTTTGKLSSASGEVRSFWAMQGLHAFVSSWGMGIGIGSFRSSSIITAVLGSSGAIGMIALICYLLRVFRPFSAETYSTAGNSDRDTATAASWAVIMVLVPASVAAPSADPGLLWGLLAGTALGLRNISDRLARAVPAVPGNFAPFQSKSSAGGGRSAVTSMSEGADRFGDKPI